MLQPKHDPFFEDLRADLQAAADELDRGEAYSAEFVWADLERRHQELQERLKSERNA